MNLYILTTLFQKSYMMFLTTFSFFEDITKANPSIKHKALLIKDHVDKGDKTIHL